MHIKFFFFQSISYYSYFKVISLRMEIQFVALNSGSNYVRIKDPHQLCHSDAIKVIDSLGGNFEIL